jgi:5'-nucleotidase/UDP-sugar diphosphatase
MKRKCIFLLVVFLLTSVLYAVPVNERGSGELILLHTNDFHGTTLPNNRRGGLAEVAAFVRAVRTINPQVLLVDAGDINTGSALSNMFDAEPEILAYNMMAYDAVTFGNHEFDATQVKLENQIKLAKFPFVSSNIKTSDGNFLGGNQYIIKQFGNIKVGIFGITTTRTWIIASPDKSLVFMNEIDAAREVVKILHETEKVDIVIGLTHLGDVKEAENSITSIDLMKAVPGIDIIIDGHSHTLMTEPVEFGKSWIVSANEWGKYIGHARIKIQNGEITDFTWAPIAIGPDMEINKMLAPYVEKANAALKEVVGEAADTFVFGNRLTRYQETAIGNLITDANVWYLREVAKQELDFAFHNGGNMRAELPKGQITREQILTILPFENYLYVASMSGAEIIELFDFIASIPQGNGGFAQFSGDVRLTIDKGKVSELTIGGKPVDPDKIYRFCTNDYILGGGDGYEVMKKAREPFNVSLLLSYVVMEYIKTQKTITPTTDGRLTIN